MDMAKPGSGTVRVDQSHLEEMIDRLGRVGRVPSTQGIVRPVYSSAWREAQTLVSEFMRDAGLTVREDAVGNVFGRLDGVDDSTCVLTGSHIDTVISGGAYDGALGVVAGISALAALAHEPERPRTAVEVVSLCEEEGSRFHANFFGTRSILGMVTADEVEQLVDQEGISLLEAGRSVAVDVGRFAEARRDDVTTFLELHIEQGRRLQDLGVDVGIVDVISGLAWLEVTVEGSTDHAGATAMAHRRDAFQAAARMAIAAEEAAIKHGPPAVTTTGIVHVEPGGANIVPGTVRFTVDVRHPDAVTLARLVDDIRDRCAAVAAEREVEVEVKLVKDTPPHDLDAGLRTLLREAASRCGSSWVDLSSGAGHDSQTMGTRIPTAMVFVPSVEGRSHSPAEFSRPEDCARGASVLATALHALAWE